MTRPSAFNYTDYRRFLIDWCEYQRESGRSLTYRHIAEEVGFSSAGHLTMILKRQANLSPRFLPRLAGFLKLGKRETAYFGDIVRFNQAKHHRDKLKYFSQLSNFKRSCIHLVDAKQYEFYDTWYHSVIRVLMEFFPVRDNFAELARLLIPAIRPGEARKSVELLVRLKLVRKDTDGCYRPTDLIVSSGWHMQSMAITNYVTKTTALAIQAAERFPADKRNLSTLTLGISQRGFSRLQNEIRQFRKRLLEIAREEKADTVYQLGIQFFPVSKTIKQAEDVQ